MLEDSGIRKDNVSALVGLSIQGETKSEPLFVSAAGSTMGKHNVLHIPYVNLGEDRSFFVSV